VRIPDNSATQQNANAFLNKLFRKIPCIKSKYAIIRPIPSYDPCGNYTPSTYIAGIRDKEVHNNTYFWLGSTGIKTD